MSTAGMSKTPKKGVGKSGGSGKSSLRNSLNASAGTREDLLLLLKDHENLASARDKTIKGLELKLEEVNPALDKNKELIREKKLQITELKVSLSELKKSHRADVMKERESMARNAEKLKSRIISLEDRLKDLNSIHQDTLLKLLNSERDRLSAENESSSLQQEKLSAEVSIRDLQEEKLFAEKSIIDLNGEINRLIDDLSASEIRASQLLQRNEILNGKYKKSREILSDFKGRLAKREIQLRNIKNSFGWKLFVPARTLKRILLSILKFPTK